nr:hypothetical protein [Tanacetum cinerariifolium]
WPLRVTLGRLLPHARGLGFKPRREGFPSGAKKEWGLSPKAKVRVLHTAQLDVTKLACQEYSSTIFSHVWVLGGGELFAFVLQTTTSHENHREEEDQEGNNSPEIETLTYHVLATYDGQSTEVDVPPDIIDVVDEDDDITDDEDALPHDLADSDNEDLINVDDDDGVDKMSADVAWSHGGDGGGKDRPLHTMYPTVAWVALLTEVKANESPI